MTDDLSDRLRRLVDRAQPVDLDEVFDRRPTPRRGWVLAATATTVVLVAVVAAVALRAQGDDPSPVTTPSVVTTPTTEPAPTTAPTTTGPTTTTVPTTPEVFAGVTEDGRLVVVDVATGAELRELDALGDPTVPVEPGDGPGPNVIDRVEVVPATGQVLYSDCCEPAAGSIYAVGLDGSPTTYPQSNPGGDRPFLFGGYDPAVSANGTVLTASAGLGAVMYFPVTDPSAAAYVDESHAGSAGTPEWLTRPGWLTYVVWGEDGHLAVHDGTSVRRFTPPVDTRWTNPVPVGDDILVIEQCCGANTLPADYESAVARLIDVESGAVLASIPLEGAVADQDAATTGLVLLTYADGRVVSLDPATGALTDIASGFRAASW